MEKRNKTEKSLKLPKRGLPHCKNLRIFFFVSHLYYFPWLCFVDFFDFFITLLVKDKGFDNEDELNHLRCVAAFECVIPMLHMVRIVG